MKVNLKQKYSLFLKSWLVFFIGIDRRETNVPSLRIKLRFLMRKTIEQIRKEKTGNGQLGHEIFARRLF